MQRYKASRSIRDARLLEKIERQQNVDRLKQQQESRAQHFHAIQQHAFNIRERKHMQQTRFARLGQAVLNYHQYAKREQLKRSGQITRERMRALRNDDENTYIELIDKTKDTRLTHILEQTDAFLNALSTAVLDQQARQGFSYANYLARDHQEVFIMMGNKDETDFTQQGYTCRVLWMTRIISRWHMGFRKM